MKGAPPTKLEIVDQIDVMVRCVDRVGRTMDDKWGVGRLRTLVPIEWAERFRSQEDKFSLAVWGRNVEDCRKHSEAMLRAYDKLDQLATEAGAEQGPAEQWEFQVGDALVVLVRDRARMNQAVLNGRQAQVWSLDEIASVIAAQPALGAAKDAIPGAEVLSVRPAPKMLEDLSDDLPF